MKILYLTHALPKFPGDRTTVFIRELALAFKQAGHDIIVLAPYHPELDLTYQQSLFTFKTFHYLPLKKWEILGYGQGMSDGLHQNKLNFIFGPFMIFFGCIAATLTALRLKPDFLFANWGIPDGFIGAVAAGILRKKLIITYIGADVKIITSKPFYGLFARFSSRIATVLTTNGHDLQNELVKAGLPENNFRFVVYGASKEIFKPDSQDARYFRNKLGLSDSTFVIGSIGRFVDKKGFSYFVEAANIVTRNKAVKADIRFVLFGAGENEKLLRQQINKYNLTDKFLLPGPVPPEQLSKVYNCMDIFTNPAVRKPPDGLNVVVVEAMACAKPVVATDACGNELVIRNGENGFLVPEMDAQSLSDKFILLINDPDLRKRMGEKSRELFLNSFSWDTIVSQYINYVNEA